MKRLASSPRLLLAAALLLPIMALAYSWIATYRLAQQGQEWLIPIRGYDPRDLLRGHYIQYQYDWPVDASRDGHNGGKTSFDASLASQLCVEGTAPHIVRVRELNSIAGRPDAQQITGCAIIVRASIGTRRAVRGLDSGILFTSQANAPSLSRRLADADEQGLVRVRIRPDGVMRPIGLEFGKRQHPD